MKKVFLLLPAFLSYVIPVFAQNNDTVQDYIYTYKEIAIAEMMRTGVPAAITLAQGILESQSGQSDLVKRSNNHFGIKCKSEWTGAVVYHDDDARNECFRSYQSAEDSYRDHSDFLKNRPYYTSLFNLDPTDYEGWAYGLKKAGYATERNYAQMLLKVINENNLQQYTLIALQRKQNNQQPIFAGNQRNPVPQNTLSVQSSPQVSVNNTSLLQTSAQENEENDKQAETSAKVAQTIVNAPTYPSGIFVVNQAKVIYAQPGTSLFALAINYNIAYKKLLEFNEMNPVTVLNEGQLIFLEKKSRKGDKDIHVVMHGETLEKISQIEGVQLGSLLAYNYLQKGMQPAEGEKIYLRTPAQTTPQLQKNNLK